MIRYRNEAYSGSGERDPVTVLTFETRELGNTDGIEEMMTRFSSPDSDLYAEGKSLLEPVENGEECEEEAEEFFRKAVAEAEKKSGTEIRSALWLAGRDTVLDLYGGNAGEIVLEGYDVSDAVILDDLGYDGTLYGFPRDPYPYVRELFSRTEKGAYISHGPVAEDAVRGALTEAEKLHPYRVPGKLETYDNYNQGWEDALDKISSMLHLDWSSWEAYKHE